MTSERLDVWGMRKKKLSQQKASELGAWRHADHPEEPWTEVMRHLLIWSLFQY